MKKKLFSFYFVIFFISSFFSFPPYKTIGQSIKWTRAYHDDYGRPLYTGGSSYSSPTFVDIDGDGDYDYFQGCRDGTIWFFENVGTPDSAAWHFVTEKYNGIYFDYLTYTTASFADVDADGDFDMFIGGETYKNPTTYGIHFFRNDGDPDNPVWTYVTAKYHNINTNIDPGVPGNPHYSHTQLVDIDDDGDLDLFFISWQGRIAYYANIGSDSIPNYTLVTENMLNTSFSNAFKNTIEFADIDNDNDFDLFINGIVFYRNTGGPDSAIWTLETYHYFDLDYARGAAAVDIDKDLDLDIFVSFLDGQVYQFENIGTPASALWQLALVNAFTIDVGDRSNPSFVDIDNDGMLEMFITSGIINVSGGEESIRFYENDGLPSAPKWTLVSTYFDSITHTEMSGLSFVDIDNDGDYDMFMGDVAVGGIIFHENFGSPTSPQFSRNGQIVFNIPNRIFLDPAFADIDADGDYDMFISERDSYAGYDALLHYYRNDGDAYQPIWTHVFSQVYPFGTVTFFDEDGDDDLDMFYGGWGYEYGNIIFYENIGDKYNFNFQLVTGYYGDIDIGPPIDPSNVIYSINYSPIFADIDSDGDLDLMIGEEDGGINLFRNDGVVGIKSIEDKQKPEVYILYQNYPNPFNPTTIIKYQLPKTADVKLEIFNILGQKVKTLVDAQQPADYYRIEWDGSNNNGVSVGTGVYLCRLIAEATDGSENFVKVKKMLLVR
jgi:hypothetical protein